MAFLKRNTRFLDILIGVMLILYPFLVLGGLRYFSARPVSLALIALLGLRFLFSRSELLPKWSYFLVLVPLSLGVALDSSFYLRWQPVLINGVLGSLFALSLYKGMPVVERLARIRHPELPELGVRYCRKVTQIWVAFFVFNGSLALYTTLFCSFTTWTLYNGLIAYVLIGTLGLGEFLVRMKVMKAQ